MKQFYDKQTITHSDSPDTSWRSLLYFNLYRIFVYALFLLIAIQAWLRGAWEAMPIQNGALLLGVSAVSLALALAAVTMIRYRRPSFGVQVHGYVFLDIVSFTLIMNAMGGVGSGVGVLLVASLGTGALLLARHPAGRAIRQSYRCPDLPRQPRRSRPNPARPRSDGQRPRGYRPVGRC